ncbi:MAG TPA: PHP domain-containing protein [Dehalococcoidia bacterium]|nr:PHP domain-containing protein [Dehalococcoidia bacterium]
MLIDLHTHTQPLSHDSLLTPDDLIEAARAAGLDGVCLTEHDFVWDPDKVRDLARRHRFLVLPGIEVNTEHGHVLVFGLDRYVYGIHRIAELARQVEAAGGVMVAAHPYRRQLPFELKRDGDWSQALERALANPTYRHVCAVETHNGRGSARENAFARELCDRLALPAVAASDAHARDDVGRCATEFPNPIRDLADLTAALKVGRFQPVMLRPDDTP